MLLVLSPLLSFFTPLLSASPSITSPIEFFVFKVISASFSNSPPLYAIIPSILYPVLAVLPIVIAAVFFTFTGLFASRLSSAGAPATTLFILPFASITILYKSLSLASLFLFSIAVTVKLVFAKSIPYLSVLNSAPPLASFVKSIELICESVITKSFFDLASPGINPPISYLLPCI